jgi:hexosaminidase
LSVVVLLAPAAGWAEARPSALATPIIREADLSGEWTRARTDIALDLPLRAGPVLRTAGRRFEERVTQVFGIEGRGPALRVRIECACAPGSGLELGSDESYALSIARSGVRIRAHSEVGVMRAFATLLQLGRRTDEGVSWPVGRIEDAPRFPWRGLMIDVARHFQSPEALRRQIDAMELVKLNVLHLHLSDAEAFRVESRLYPRLHEFASFGRYYTQDDIRALVAYAAERGVRLVPEFDLPGHSLAMIAAYPMLASAPPPDPPWTLPVRRNAVIDPTREEVYDFLKALLGEMSGLFPDPYLHTGADEVNGVEWSENPAIAAFMKERGYGDADALQAYFSARMHTIVTGLGKTMIGWDEVYAPGLPDDVVVQSWTSSKMTGRAARAGHRVIVSAGYYLDWLTPSAALHSRDPLDLTAHGMSEEAFLRVRGTPLERLVNERFRLDPSLRLEPGEEARILGGEAAMWTELVTEEKLDAAVWPRAAAVADRLWSRSDVEAVALEDRLASVSVLLEAAGLRHRSAPAAMLARLAPDGGAALTTLVEALEPVKFYAHNQEMRSGGRAPPQSLTDLADALPPESLTARRFNRLAEAWGAGETDLTQELSTQLTRWRDNDRAVQDLAVRYPALAPAALLSRDLADLSRAALAALTYSDQPQPADVAEIRRIDELIRVHRAWEAASVDALSSFMRPQPPGDLLMAPLAGLRALIEAGRARSGVSEGPAKAG